VGAICVHFDVTVPIVGPSLFQRHALVPAMHAADRIRLNRESQVLVYANLVPPDAAAVGVAALERTRSMHLSHPVPSTLPID